MPLTVQITENAPVVRIYFFKLPSDKTTMRITLFLFRFWEGAKSVEVDTTLWLEASTL